jgi:opacity protein-like surface antigen
MKKLILLCLVFLPFSLFSQTTQNDSLKFNNAILFNFNGLNLNAFDNGFGLKKWLSDNIALNGKMKISVHKDEKERTDALNGSEDYQNSFELTVGLERHFGRIYSLSPYIGGQLGYGYERIENKIIPNTAFSFLGPSTYLYELEIRSSSVSLQMVVGVEYFLRKNISLSGQYSIGGFYSFGTEKTVSTTVDDKQDISEWHLGISNSALILSIYLW